MAAATIVTILAFLAAFFAIVAVNLAITDLFERDRKEMLKRMEEELRVRQRERARESARTGQSQDFGHVADEAFRHSSHEQKGFWERLDDLIEQSGVQTTTTRLVILSVTGGGLVALVGLFLSGNVLVAVLGGSIVASLPLAYLQSARRKRFEKLRAQLPDSLDLMARILRAGQTITQAMQSVASEFSAPVGTELGYCYEQQNLGLAPELALRDLARRTGLLEIKILVLSLLVHRQAGGNLADLLDKLATIVRERFKLRGQIRTLTAEGRLQAVMLLALPPAMFGLLMVVNRDYAIKLFDHPTLVIATLISMAVGAFWIHKIVNFDY